MSSVNYDHLKKNLFHEILYVSTLGCLLFNTSEKLVLLLTRIHTAHKITYITSRGLFHDYLVAEEGNRKLNLSPSPRASYDGKVRSYLSWSSRMSGVPCNLVLLFLPRG